MRREREREREGGRGGCSQSTFVLYGIYSTYSIQGKGERANALARLTNTKSRFVGNRDLKQTRTTTTTSGGKKNISSYSRGFVNIYLVPLFVSIFAEVQLPPLLFLNEKIQFTTFSVKTMWKWSSVASFERTAQMSALFQTFTRTFCLV